MWPGDTSPGYKSPPPLPPPIVVAAPNDDSPTISNFSDSSPMVPGLFVRCKFCINKKFKNILAFVDCGNTFHNCISESTCLKLGIQLNQLQTSSRANVRQAGGGATLPILGQIPDTDEYSFQFDGLSRQFPLKNFFVLRGLNHDFNISLPFLQEHGFQIDLNTNTLNFEENSQIIHIPFVSKFKVSFSIQRISPMVAKRGLPVKPRQHVVVKSSGTMNDSFFVTREPDFSPKHVRELNQI